MEPLKKEAINVIAKLPDDADMEELIDRKSTRLNSSHQ